MNKLLNEIKRLQELVSSVEGEKPVSLHFFSEAFDLAYKIQESLVDLESKQIECLQHDMEIRKARLSVPRQADEALLEQLNLLQPEIVEIPGEHKQPENTDEIAPAPDPVVSDELFRTVQEIVNPQPHVPENAIAKKEGDDIRKLLSLNDRFRFQRELFNGNAFVFNNMLDALNSMGSYAEAADYIHSQMDWSEEAEITVEFYGILERFYSA